MIDRHNFFFCDVCGSTVNLSGKSQLTQRDVFLAITQTLREIESN